MRKEILVIGKSGVGKSSLINYLFDGEELCETGAGKPVTGKGIFRKKYMKDYYLYDTWGLEPDKKNEWKKMLSDCLENKQKKEIDLPFKGYFDTVFYCLSAKGARLEDAEKEIIEMLWNSKQVPIVVLTKSNIASEKEKNSLKEQLRKIDGNIDIVEIGSVEEETFSGKVETFGKENVERLIYISHIDKLVNFAPSYLIKKSKEELEKQKKRIKQNIDKKLYDTDSYNEEIKKVVNEMIPQKLEKDLKKILSLYNFNINLEIQKYSSVTTTRVITYAIIGVLDILTTPFLPLTAIAGILDYFTLERRLNSHLDETVKKIGVELEKLEESIKKDIQKAISVRIICPKCGSKLKVVLNKSAKCPSCQNIENVTSYYKK
ncbi:GTPase [Cetobacterium sp.]|uniref:GTPase n=1 Tax=Cetobacterium sp. TaxID=2071632 RepID=UPI003F3EF653